jgi:hypothetical protein
MMAEGTDFSQKISALGTAARHQRGLEPTSDLRRALNDLAGLADIDDAAIADLLAELGSPTGAGFLAVWLGARVEGGGDPDRTCRTIVETLLKWSRTIKTGPDGAAEGDSRGDLPLSGEETIAGMQLLGMALVAHLARAPHLRRWCAETNEIGNELRRVEHHSIGAEWVLELLRQRSGEIIVLNVKHRIGVVIRYNNISNCFHLFTLLQGALTTVMPDAQNVSEQLLDIARGKRQGEGYDRAWWHYGEARAATPSLAESVWGEAGPDSISSIDGRQVLLLWPPIMRSRSWHTSCFPPILHACPPGVEVAEVLSSSAVEAWWLRLSLA